MPLRPSLHSRFKRKKESDLQQKWKLLRDKSLQQVWSLRKLPTNRNWMARLLSKMLRKQKSPLRLLERLLRLLMRRANMQLNLKPISLLPQLLRKREKLNS